MTARRSSISCAFRWATSRRAKPASWRRVSALGSRTSRTARTSASCRIGAMAIIVAPLQADAPFAPGDADLRAARSAATRASSTTRSPAARVDLKTAGQALYVVRLSWGRGVVVGARGADAAPVRGAADQLVGDAPPPGEAMICVGARPLDAAAGGSGGRRRAARRSRSMAARGSRPARPAVFYAPTARPSAGRRLDRVPRLPDCAPRICRACCAREDTGRTPCDAFRYSYFLIDMTLPRLR